MTQTVRGKGANRHNAYLAAHWEVLGRMVFRGPFGKLKHLLRAVEWAMAQTWPEHNTQKTADMATERYRETWARRQQEENQ